MQTRTILAPVVALLVAASGIAGCGTQSAGDPVLPGGDDCFWARSIHNWRALDERSLIVWSPGRSCPYLVEFGMRCIGIRTTEDLAFYDRDGRICPYGGDAVIVPGPSGDRCSIVSVRRLSETQLATLLGKEPAADAGTAPAGACPPGANEDPG